MNVPCEGAIGKLRGELPKVPARVVGDITPGDEQADRAVGGHRALQLLHHRQPDPSGLGLDLHHQPGLAQRPEELLTAVLASEGLLDLFGVCVEASARTSLALKHRMLARLLAEGHGESDRTTLDDRVHMARILGDLEQPHFVVLGELASVETATLVGLAALLDPPRFVDSALGTLIRNGLVRDVHQFLSPRYPTSYTGPGGDSDAPKGGQYAITVLGRDFCRWAQTETGQP